MKNLMFVKLKNKAGKFKVIKVTLEGQVGGWGCLKQRRLLFFNLVDGLQSIPARYNTLTGDINIVCKNSVFNKTNKITIYHKAVYRFLLENNIIKKDEQYEN
jgi:hypothetical protein